jgi:hypothetical protein
MGIASESKLFVGAYFSYIKCDNEKLREMVDNDNIIRVSPYYDAVDQHCYFGTEVTTREIMEDGGIERIRRIIGAMNELFQTNACELIHSLHIW